MKFSLLFELRDISKEVIYFENIFFIFLGGWTVQFYILLQNKCSLKLYYFKVLWLE